LKTRLKAWERVSISMASEIEEKRTLSDCGKKVDSWLGKESNCAGGRRDYNGGRSWSMLRIPGKGK
jgi:hypothetical protein